MSEPVINEPLALRGIDGLVCDLDGVIYRGTQRLDGAAEALDVLRERGVRVVFATNNATMTVDERLARMSDLGVDASPEELVTSAVVTAEHLVERGLGGGKAFVIGRSGIRSALSEAGIGIVTAPDATEADAVVVSGDDTFDYAALHAASSAARAGAYLVATNDDPTFPGENGLRPGAGALLAAVERASGRTATVIGKPHAPLLDAAARRLEGCERIAAIGDQPATDLVGAYARGWATILVLSGVTAAADLPRLTLRPSAVVDGLHDVPELLTSS